MQAEMSNISQSVKQIIDRFYTSILTKNSLQLKENESKIRGVPRKGLEPSHPEGTRS